MNLSNNLCPYLGFTLSRRTTDASVIDVGDEPLVFKAVNQDGRMETIGLVRSNPTVWSEQRSKSARKQITQFHLM
jgi:hypothetical protein